MAIRTLTHGLPRGGLGVERTRRVPAGATGLGLGALAACTGVWALPLAVFLLGGALCLVGFRGAGQPRRPIVGRQGRRFLEGAATGVLIVVAVMVVAFVLAGNCADGRLWLRWAVSVGAAQTASVLVARGAGSRSVRFSMLALVLATGALAFLPAGSESAVVAAGMVSALFVCGLALCIQCLRGSAKAVKEVSDGVVN